MLNLSPSPAMRRPGGSLGSAVGKAWGRTSTPASRTMSGQIGAQRPPIGNRPMGPQQGPGMMTPQFGPSAPIGNKPPMGGPEMSAEMPSTGINTGPSQIGMNPSSMPVLYGGGMGNAGPTSGGMQGIPGQQFNMNNPAFQGMAPMNDLWANYNKMMGLGNSATPSGNLFY